VAAVVAYFPPVDLREWVGPNDSFPALEFDPKQAESVSPLLHVTSDDPPTLLIHGNKDDLVKLDNSERILAAFQKATVPCELIVIEGAGHGFAGENGKRASKALVDWFDKHLATNRDRDDAATGKKAAATP
jgi:dipeptidyl aminopeptidase/acylaminoacyl peptidase